MENKLKTAGNIIGATAMLGLAVVCPPTATAIAPLLIGGLASGLASSYIYDTINPFVRRKWAGKEGIFNHDINRAFRKAYKQCIRRIVETYLTGDIDERERKSVKTFLKDVTDHADKHLDKILNEKASVEEIDRYLFPSTESIAETTDALLPAYFTNADGYFFSSEFIRFFSESFTQNFSAEFLDVVNKDEAAKGKIMLFFDHTNFQMLQKITTETTLTTGMLMEISQFIKTAYASAPVYQSILPEQFEELVIGIDKKADLIRDDLKRIEKKIDDKYNKWPHDLNIIPIHTGEFIGREDDILKLHEVLGSAERVLLMNGLGGIGKTTLAKKYLQKYHDAYAHMVWVEVKATDTMASSDNLEGLYEAFAYDVELLKTLKIEFAKEENVQRFLTVMQELKNIDGGTNILVIDNAGIEVEQVQQYLPAAPQWRVLITSRTELPDFELYTVDTLSPEKALELFKKFYPHEGQDEEIKLLLKEIEYHTLSIELFAKTMHAAKGGLTVKYVLAQVRSRHIDSDDLQKKIKTSHTHGETKLFAHLITAFDLSSLTEDEKFLMKQFAVLPSEPYPVKILQEWLQIEDTDINTFHEILDNLYKKGWLKATKDYSYSMHRLIQQIVHYQMKLRIDDVAALIKYFANALYLDHSTNVTLLFPFLRYAEFLIDCLKEMENLDDGFNVLLNNIGVVSRNSGNYVKARYYCEKSIEYTIKKLGEDHSSVATGRANLALLLKDLGAYIEARKLLEAALASDIKNFGEDHPTVGIDQSNLAMVLQDLGDYIGAKALLEKALISSIKELNDDHPTIAIRRSNLATVLKNLEDYSGARDLLEKALAADLRNFGEDHPAVSTDRSNLAIVLRNLGDYEGAKALLEKALISDIKNFGDGHLAVAIVRSNLALVLRHIGDYQTAKDLLEKSLTSDIHNFGNDHPDIAIDRSNLAGVLLNLGDYITAKYHYEQALKIAMQSWGPEHPSTKIIQGNIEYLNDLLNK